MTAESSRELLPDLSVFSSGYFAGCGFAGRWPSPRTRTAASRSRRSGDGARATTPPDAPCSTSWKGGSHDRGEGRFNAAGDGGTVLMPITQRLRYEILRRDNHTCRYCGHSAPDVKLTVDHVVPTALGGRDEPENLVTAEHCWRYFAGICWNLLTELEEHAVRLIEDGKV